MLKELSWLVPTAIGVLASLVGVIYTAGVVRSEVRHLRSIVNSLPCVKPHCEGDEI